MNAQVAQIFNLLYRRFAICRAWTFPVPWSRQRLPSAFRRYPGLQICATCFISFLLASGAAAADINFEDLFISGTNGYHTYRIPALLLARNGTVLAFCEGRKHSGRDTGKVDLL